jgi:hypothetical protein
MDPERESYADHEAKRRLPPLLTLAIVGVGIAAVGVLLLGCLWLLARPIGPTD